MENEQALSHCEKVCRRIGSSNSCYMHFQIWYDFKLQNTPIQIYMEFPTSETVAIPLRESGVGNYVLAIRCYAHDSQPRESILRLAVISPFSSNVSVLRELIIESALGQNL